MPFANNKGIDQPVHPRSLISAFGFRCLDSIIYILAKSKLSRLKLVSVAEFGVLPGRKPPKTGFLMTCLEWELDRCIKGIMDFMAIQ